MQVYIRTGQRAEGEQQHTITGPQPGGWDGDNGQDQLWGQWGSAGIPDTRVDWGDWQ